uniref:Uncharacterized protein n=1 Tax=Caenorhabditis japonica TaxID=281687 RepID=A0A8R1ILY8_CAEJA
MPRQLTTRYDYSKTQLILFSDASKNNYGITAYIRFEFPSEPASCALLLAKSRVKPLKEGERMTIPRLELTSLETSTNCAVFLTQQLHNLIPFESVELFCDSIIALGWDDNTQDTEVRCEA